jgi:hypothetical protein
LVGSDRRPYSFNLYHSVPDMSSLAPPPTTTTTHFALNFSPPTSSDVSDADADDDGLMGFAATALTLSDVVQGVVQRSKPKRPVQVQADVKKFGTLKLSDNPMGQQSIAGSVAIEVESPSPRSPVPVRKMTAKEEQVPSLQSRLLSVPYKAVSCPVSPQRRTGMLYTPPSLEPSLDTSPRLPYSPSVSVGDGELLGGEDMDWSMHMKERADTDELEDHEKDLQQEEEEGTPSFGNSIPHSPLPQDFGHSTSSTARVPLARTRSCDTNISRPNQRSLFGHSSHYSVAQASRNVKDLDRKLLRRKTTQREFEDIQHLLSYNRTRQRGNTLDILVRLFRQTTDDVSHVHRSRTVNERLSLHHSIRGSSIRRRVAAERLPRALELKNMSESQRLHRKHAYSLTSSAERSPNLTPVLSRTSSGIDSDIYNGSGSGSGSGSSTHRKIVSSLSLLPDPEIGDGLPLDDIGTCEEAHRRVSFNMDIHTPVHHSPCMSPKAPHAKPCLREPHQGMFESWSEAFGRLYREYSAQQTRAMSLMSKGVDFTKISADTTEKRRFMMAFDNGEIWWGADFQSVYASRHHRFNWSRLTTGHRIKHRSLADVEHLVYGGEAGFAFNKYLRKGGMPWRCFTVKFVDGFELHVVTDTDKQAQDWFMAFQSMMPMTYDYIPLGKLLWMRARLRIVHRARTCHTPTRNVVDDLYRNARLNSIYERQQQQTVKPQEQLHEKEQDHEQVTEQEHQEAKERNVHRQFGRANSVASGLLKFRTEPIRATVENKDNSNTDDSKQDDDDAVEDLRTLSRNVERALRRASTSSLALYRAPSTDAILELDEDIGIITSGSDDDKTPR